MKAYVFPGQGAQFTGMGLDLYENSPLAQEYFEKANDILGFSITDIMFEGTAEQLKQTKVTQPAIFLHSVILAKVLGDSFQPEMVAGHSLGELSALVANDVLSFEDGLRAEEELSNSEIFAWYLLCFLADLKIGTLKHQDIGQMQMYVNYFDREIKIDDDLAKIEYSLQERKIFLTKLIIPDSVKDEGFKKEFLSLVFEQIESRNLSVMPTCPEIAKFVRGNRKYKRMLPVGVRI